MSIRRRVRAFARDVKRAVVNQGGQLPAMGQLDPTAFEAMVTAWAHAAPKERIPALEAELKANGNALHTYIGESGGLRQAWLSADVFGGIEDLDAAFGTPEIPNPTDADIYKAFAMALNYAMGNNPPQSWKVVGFARHARFPGHDAAELGPLDVE